MRAIDTNVLIRLVSRDDPRQVASAEAFVRDGAWISNLVLAGAIWVLGAVTNYRQNGRPTRFEMLPRHRELVVQDAETVTSALELFRAKPALGLSDCLMLYIARKAGHLPPRLYANCFPGRKTSRHPPPIPPVFFAIFASLRETLRTRVYL